MSNEEYDDERILNDLIHIRTEVNSLIYILEQRIDKKKMEEMEIGERILYEMEKQKELDDKMREIFPPRYPRYYTISNSKLPDVRYDTIPHCKNDKCDKC